LAAVAAGLTPVVPPVEQAAMVAQEAADLTIVVHTALVQVRLDKVTQAEQAVFITQITPVEAEAEEAKARLVLLLGLAVTVVMALKMLITITKITITQVEAACLLMAVLLVMLETAG